MVLADYIQILWRRKWIILVTILGAVLAAVLGSSRLPTRYTASALIRIVTPPVGNFDWAQYDTLYGDRLLNTFSLIAVSGPIIGEVMDTLNLSVSPNIGTELISNSEVMRVVAVDEDPVRARDIANALAGILIDHGRELYVGDMLAAAEVLEQQLTEAETRLSQARLNYASLTQPSVDSSEEDVEEARVLVVLYENSYNTLLYQHEQVRLRAATQPGLVTLVEASRTPGSPGGPSKMFIIASALVGGAIAGLGLAFLVENLDTRLYTTRDIEAVAQHSSLGQIEFTHNLSGVVPTTSSEAEMFRHLRANFLALREKQDLRTVSLTSAEPGEGKSIVTANLAAAIARTGLRVVVVDANLRNPTLHQVFKLTNDIGLSDLLCQEIDVLDTLQCSEISGLEVITGGMSGPDSIELLGSSRMKDLLAKLSERFDMVMVDTAAFLPAADAAIVGAQVDGVLLVVARSLVNQQAVKKTCQSLDDGANLLGIVVNYAERQKRYKSYFRTVRN